MPNHHYEYSRRDVSSRNLRRFIERMERDIIQMHNRIPTINLDVCERLITIRELMQCARLSIVNKPRK